MGKEILIPIFRWQIVVCENPADEQEARPPDCFMPAFYYAGFLFVADQTLSFGSVMA